jgi:fructose-1,6-bisphosphatase/inositol monophosphatase family enzyme
VTLTDAELAAELVRSAGRLAHRMRDAGVRVAEKTSVSDLVTSADRAAEEAVVGRLAEQRPDDGILGEEGSSRVGSSGRTWVVDPVDGTYNFFHGVRWWCSALALVDGDDLVLGAVHDPHDDVLWLGGPGLPTTRDGVPVDRLEDRPLADLSLATYLHPPYFGEPAVEEPFGRLAAGTATLRMLGSGSMDLAAVADGRIGVWAQHSSPPWDWFPGSALVVGAGGAAERVEVDGYTWSVAGPARAVSEAVAALRGDVGSAPSEP